MNSSFVLVNCDIHCDPKDVTKSPVYRLYVNDELFAERAWAWTNVYLEELLQIAAPPGSYNIKLENATPDVGQVSMHNVRVKQGPAKVSNNNCLEIQL